MVHSTQYQSCMSHLGSCRMIIARVFGIIGSSEKVLLLLDISPSQTSGSLTLKISKWRGQKLHLVVQPIACKKEKNQKWKVEVGIEYSRDSSSKISSALHAQANGNDEINERPRKLPEDIQKTKLRRRRLIDDDSGNELSSDFTNSTQNRPFRNKKGFKMLDGLFMLLALSVVMAVAYDQNPGTSHQLLMSNTQILPSWSTSSLNVSFTDAAATDIGDWSGSLGWDITHSHYTRGH